MLPSINLIGGSEENEQKDFTLIVKRTYLTLYDQDCTVLNFTDISANKYLKQEEEKNRQITAHTTSIHHEMLVPLRNNIEFAECLTKHLTQEDLKKKASLILIASKMAMFNANDLLDMRFL